MKKVTFIVLGLSVSLSCLQFPAPVFALGAPPHDVGITQLPSVVSQADAPRTTDPGVANPSGATEVSTITTPSAITEPPKTGMPVDVPKVVDSEKPDTPVATPTSQSDIKYKVSGYIGEVSGSLTVDILLDGVKIASINHSGVKNAKEINLDDEVKLKTRLRGKGSLNGFKLEFERITPVLPPVIVPPVIVPPIVVPPIVVPPIVVPPVVVPPAVIVPPEVIDPSVVIDSPVIVPPVAPDPVVPETLPTEVATEPTPAINQDKPVAPVDAVESVRPTNNTDTSPSADTTTPSSHETDPSPSLVD